jgi:hypothetical protein
MRPTNAYAPREALPGLPAVVGRSDWHDVHDAVGTGEDPVGSTGNPARDAVQIWVICVTILQ